MREPARLFQLTVPPACPLQSAQGTDSKPIPPYSDSPAWSRWTAYPLALPPVMLSPHLRHFASSSLLMPWSSVTIAPRRENL